MLKRLYRDKKGAIFVELILKLLIVSLIVLTAVHLFDVAIKYQHVSYTTKSIAKIIELEGAVTPSASQQLTDLNNSFGMDMTFYVTDVHYFNAASKTIQFRDRFTVTVYYLYKFPVFDPIFTTAPVTVNIPMQSGITGMSEVYWKI
jgi:Flp pilus assembly protein TadG